ncbi:MAG TPA: GspH/FimT family pseudopilin [Thermoanaerobaculia bacterium]|nr:GspH/FimT family pseudopilin [Thermoanaerobaculia bacterium]
MRPHGYKGFSLIEALLIVAIVGLIASAAIPAFSSIHRRSAVRAASKEMQAIFHLARSRAIARGTNTGVKFIRFEGDWFYAIYDDVDGDGVRNDDIDDGTDHCFRKPRLLLPHAGLATIGLPNRDLIAPDGEKLPAGSSPIRFNRSAICSFSPMGESTPGSIYLTDGEGAVYALRVFGGSARIRLLRHLGGRQWEQR